jgi:two-component system, cell cycle sensor histidine kinase and response regulator CckA
MNLNVLIEEEMSLLTTLIGESVEVRLLTAPDLKVTLADPMRIEQVLMNLCVNARDAMKDRGELVIETRNVELGSEFCREHCVDPPGSYVLLRVSDTGIGIDSATMEHIFEPFFTTKAIGKGSEIGLATLYGIFKQHGGFVFAESKVGVGSSFRVCLPVSTGGMSIAKLEMMIIVRGAAKQFYGPKITTDFEKRRERSWRRLAIACWSHRTVAMRSNSSRPMPIKSTWQ